MQTPDYAPTFEIIPAVDLRGGKCVRLHQGDYAQETVYSDDPVAMGLQWQEAGAPRLHVVDLDGAREGQPRNLEVAGRIASALSIPADLGGGIRSAETAARVLEAGFQRFSIGTRALDAGFAREIFAQFGDAAIADIAARDGKVSVAGWQQQSDVDALELGKRLVDLGCRRIIFTDISRDGTLQGPNMAAVKRMAEATGIAVVASGGVSKAEDLLQLAPLHALGVEGAIVGKALYDGRLDLRQALQMLRSAT